FAVIGAVSLFIYSCKPTANQGQGESDVEALAKRNPKPPVSAELVPFVSCLKEQRKMDNESYDLLVEKYEKCIQSNSKVLSFEKCAYVSGNQFDRISSTFINTACLNVFSKQVNFDKCYSLTKNSNAGSASRQDVAIKCLNLLYGSLDRKQCESMIPFLSGPVPEKEWSAKCAKLK
ncbi:MAG: hypothetical protein ACO3A4_14855, partial [Silvanigrellaceae bacterium]